MLFVVGHWPFVVFPSSLWPFRMLSVVSRWSSAVVLTFWVRPSGMLFVVGRWRSTIFPSSFQPFGSSLSECCLSLVVGLPSRFALPECCLFLAIGVLPSFWHPFGLPSLPLRNVFHHWPLAFRHLSAILQAFRVHPSKILSTIGRWPSIIFLASFQPSRSTPLKCCLSLVIGLPPSFQPSRSNLLECCPPSFRPSEMLSVIGHWRSVVFLPSFRPSGSSLSKCCSSLAIGLLPSFPCPFGLPK